MKYPVYTQEQQDAYKVKLDAVDAGIKEAKIVISRAEQSYQTLMVEQYNLITRHNERMQIEYDRKVVKSGIWRNPGFDPTPYQ